MYTYYLADHVLLYKHEINCSIKSYFSKMVSEQEQRLDRKGIFEEFCFKGETMKGAKGRI